MDDQNTPSEPVAEAPTPMPVSEPAPAEPISEPTEPVPEAPQASSEDQLTSTTEESPIEPTVPENSSSSETVTPESDQPETIQSVSPQSAPTPLTPIAPQTQPSAQQDQTGFIRALLAKAQAKIQSNKQKKLEKIILFAQKKKILANEDVQKLLHISSATATRYLVKLVQQGHLARVGNPRDAKYQFVR